MPKKTPAPKAATGNVPSKRATVTQLPGTKPAPVKRRPGPDLQRLEIDYRSGKLTTRELGAMHGITHGRIVQLAKEKGWTQDVSAKARHEAKILVADPAKREELTKRLTSVVSDAATEMAGIKLAHRELINTGRSIVRSLLSEVSGLSDPEMQERLEQALDAIAKAQREGDLEITTSSFSNLVTAVNRATGLATRAGVVKNLSMAAEKLIDLERVAYELDDPERNKPPAIEPDRSRSPAEHYRWLAGIRSAA